MESAYLQWGDETVEDKCDDKLAHVFKYYTLEVYRGIEVNIHPF
jgi:hypothetical protein